MCIFKDIFKDTQGDKVKTIKRNERKYTTI